jgi:hypothetical protein
LPSRTSSSWLPTTFFWGHWLSSFLFTSKKEKKRKRRLSMRTTQHLYHHLLHDIAGFNHTFQFLDHRSRDIHYATNPISVHHLLDWHLLSFLIRLSLR